MLQRLCRLLPVAVIVLPLLAPLGCSGVYDERYFYVPHPAQVDAATADARKNETVRALASVVGVRKGDPETGLPASVELRLQVENDTPGEIVVDPGELALFGGDSVRFPSPIVQPSDRQVIPPGGQTSLAAFFPFPYGERGAMDLRGLNFQWAYGADDEKLRSSVTFTRRSYSRGYPYRYRLYHGYNYGYRPGYGYYNCW